MTANISGTVSESTLDYIVYGFWDKYGDPRTTHLPLISGGPWKLFGILLVYLYTVKYLGPALMKNREPFQLRKVMLWYNMFNVIVNGFGFLIGLYITRFSTDVWGCRDKELNWPPFMINVLGYSYFILKLIDFLDTIFFVMRKKHAQVSFLHVTHHTLMPFTAYVGLKFVPGGNTGFTPLINSFVHAIMYAYYYIAAMGPEMQKYLWWKKYITKVQLFQFGLAAIHSVHVFFVPGCTYPRIISIFELSESIFFFVTFFRFYRKNYVLKNKAQ